MAKQESVIVTGTVVEISRNALFRVDLGNGTAVSARPAGKLQINNICIERGDKVEVEVSVYDTTRGRIIRRLK